MEEYEEDLSSPFWLESTTNLRRTDRYRRRVSSLFFNFGVLVILLLVTAVFFLVFIIPSLPSLTSQIFRPNTVRKTWESINIVLVLFAIALGFLSRNKNYDTNSDGYQRNDSNVTSPVQKSSPSTPHRWYDFPDRTVNSGTGMGVLRRNSSSYPDLREVSSHWVDSDDPWRFSDDTQVAAYRISDPGHIHRRKSWREIDKQESDTKNVHVDAFETREKEVLFTNRILPSSPPPQTTVALPADEHKTNRTYHKSAHKERSKKKLDSDLQREKLVTESKASPPPPPPPPPPPQPPMMELFEKKSSGSDRKRSGAYATKDFFTSLYQKKKKRQRRRSVDNLDILLHQSQTPLHFQLPQRPSSPPPTLLSPSPSALHNLFSSKNSKKRRSLSSFPPPPLLTEARGTKDSTQIASVTTREPPPLPVKLNSFDSIEEYSNSGGESPLARIPQPPPPPPFKMPVWKFVVQGDYVRIRSNNSSRSVSPDPDDVDSPSSVSESSHGTAGIVGGADTSSSRLFCPSPDVNTKADNFIARFKAGLKLEKMNSLNQKQVGLSNLGPGCTGPSPI